MRILLFTALSFLISLNTFSQAWVDCGIKGGYGVTMLTNGNIWNEPSVEPLISPGYSYGGKLGLNFNLNYQITTDFLFRSANQKYLFQPNGGDSDWTKNIKYTSFDIPLLFRHNSENGSFLELGPQISFISGAEETIDGNTTDMSNYFAKTNFGAVVGFGSFMLGAQNTYLVFGLRVHYGFQDLLTSEAGKGQNAYYPINKGELDDVEPGFQFDKYQKTSPLSALLYLELNYDLAYLVRSECKRTALRFF